MSEVTKEQEQKDGPEAQEGETAPLLSGSGKSYGGEVDESLSQTEDEEKGFGCFGRCETCGSAVSTKCASCCRSCCGSCCSCCEGKDLPAIRALQTEKPFFLNSQGKIYRYDAERLLTFRVLLGCTGTIFAQHAVYIIVPYVAFLALASLFACYIGIPHARKLDTGRFNDFVTYIKVFIAFMLGLFLNNAFKRWWSSVSYFKRFLVSIKQLMFTMHAIGIPPELFTEIERLAICSSYILNEEVHCAQMSNHKQRAERWEKVLTELVESERMTPLERRDLEEQSQCTDGKSNTLGVMSTLMWIWVAEVMSSLRGDPSCPPPMYVRLLFLCQDCMAQVELLKTNLIVQLPYTYVHMLCCMVHLINILMAVACGLAMGSALAEVQSRVAHVEPPQDEGGVEEYFLLIRVAHAVGRNHYIAEMYEAFQTLGTQFIMLLFQPLIYQSFLVIAHALCYPYGMGICHMPTETFIQQVHYELQVMASGSSNHRKRLASKLELKVES